MARRQGFMTVVSYTINMKVREATVDDRETVAEIATRSLETSYSLNPSTIESGVAEWYGPESFEETIEDAIVLVAEEEGEVVAFSESVVVTEGGQGDLHWLHVHPDHRGRGIGADLFEHTRDRLTEEGVAYLRGRVLADNRAGTEFYEEYGFEKVDEEELEIDGDRHFEHIYLDAESKQFRSVVTDGEVVYVDKVDEEVGSEAPFNNVYTNPDRETHYGYYCTNCGSLSNAMDTMGRIKCNDCGNTRKPTRWDASYM